MAQVATQILNRSMVLFYFYTQNQNWT